MNQEEVKNQFKIIIDLLKNKGCDMECILSFVNNNLEYLVNRLDKMPNINNNIYCIYNNQSLYCLLIVCNDIYEWAICKDNRFGKIKSFNKDNPNFDEYDYIVEMMIHVADSDKFKIIMPDVSNMNIEGKVKALKKIGLNSTGYHFR